VRVQGLPMMVGRVTIANGIALLAVPKTLTTTAAVPKDAARGTVTMMLVSLQVLGEAVAPFTETELVPWLWPKPVPVSVIGVPTAPDVEERLVMLSSSTRKCIGLLDSIEVFTSRVVLPALSKLGT